MLVRVFAAIAAALLVAGSGLLVAQLPAEQQAPPMAQQPATTAPSPAAPAPDTATAPSPLPSAVPSSSPSPSPPPPAPPPQVATDATSQRVASRLTKLLRRTDVGGLLGLAVLGDDGAEVFVHGADAAMVPASTQKLSVAAAALARLGPAHRYTTTVRATRPPASGVVRGDLVIVGGGDPALAGPEFARVEPERPRTALAALARDVHAAGVRRVTGDIVADPTIFAHEPAAVGWPARYFANLDATRITGLTVDGGRAVHRSGGGFRSEAAEDPALQAARMLRSLLRKAGVRVKGAVRVSREPVAAAAEIARIDSPPMAQLLRYMVQRSDNHLADMIFRSIGAAGGDSTWVGAAGATAAVLAPLELDWSAVVLADGSGLSRSNRVSARFLAQLQTRMMLSNLREQWYPLMAVSGQHGTLRHRLKGTVAEGRVYGKTGSLRDVAALVGTVVGTEGRIMHFAVVGNRLSSTWPLRELADRAALVMAEELQDCRRVRPPRRPGQRRRPPARLVCG